MSAPIRMPYPGLRAFQRDESDLFFGREDCVDDMVDKLAATRFLAVLGSSGSGKSSLVRTGLLDALEQGMNSALGSAWAIADTSPGTDPFGNLARALLKSQGVENEDDAQSLSLSLQRGPGALAAWYRDFGVAPRRLLLLVDQFEELFRFSDYAERDETEAFVATLLESASTAESPIYVVMTMRSEFLGACSLVTGLAERINAGLYLTPRMSREQCRLAIEGPAKVGGFQIEPALVSRLLNDMTSFAPWTDDESVDQLQRISRRADQLPLMQHVLNRLWQQDVARTPPGSTVTLTLQQYNLVGGLEMALDAHGREIMERLGPDLAPVAERVFRALVSGAGGLAVRRPTSFADLVALNDGKNAAVEKVLTAFRAPDCNFLMPPLSRKVTGTTLIDISHESLIRQWPLLREWAQKEDDARTQWQRLSDSAVRHKKNQAGLLQELDLKAASDWWDAEKPSHAWAKRYKNNYEDVQAYLEQSRAASEANLAREAARAAADAKGRRRNLVLAALAFLIVPIAIAAIISSVNLNHAAGELARATVARHEAQQKEITALTQFAEAKKSNDLAQEAITRLGNLKLYLENQINIATAQLRAQNRKLEQATIRSFELSAWRAFEAGDMFLASRYAAVGMTLSGPEDQERLKRIAQAIAFKTRASPNRGSFTRLISSLDFSKDGKHLLATSYDGKAAIWDLDGRNDKQQLSITHGDDINSGHFSQNGKYVVLASDDKNVSIVSTGDRTLADVLPHSEYVYTAQFFDNDSKIVTQTSQGVWLWPISAAGKRAGDPIKLVAPEASPDPGYDISVHVLGKARLIVVRGPSRTNIFDSRDGHFVAALKDADGKYTEASTIQASQDETYLLTTPGANGTAAKLWLARNGSLQNSFDDEDGVSTAAFSPDGTLVATGAYKSVKIWGLNSTTAKAHLPLESSVQQAQFLGTNNDQVVTLSAGKVKIWNLAKPSIRITFEDALSFESVTVSNGGEYLATTSNGGKVVKVWEATGYLARTIYSESELSSDIAFSEGGSRIALGYFDGRVISEEITFGKNGFSNIISYFSNSGVKKAEGDMNFVQFAGGAAERKMFIGSELGAFRLVRFNDDFETAVGQALCRPYLGKAEETKITAPTLSSNGDKLLLVVGSRAELWDYATCTKVREFSHSSSVKTAVFSPNGDQVLTADASGVIKLWPLGTKEGPRIFADPAGGLSKALISPDGKHVLSVSKKSVALWTVGDRAQGVMQTIITLKDPNKKGAPVNAAFAPDSVHFVTYDSSVLNVHAVDSPAVLQTIAWERSELPDISSVRFTPDSKGLVAVSRDAVRIWGLVEKRIISQASMTNASDTIEFLPGDTSVLLIAPSARNYRDRPWLWDYRVDRRLAELGGFGAIKSYAFSADGHVVGLTTSNSISMWDVSPFLGTAKTAGDYICSVFLPDSGRVFKKTEIAGDAILQTQWSDYSNERDVCTGKIVLATTR